MSSAAWAKVPAKTATEVYKQAPPEGEASQMLREGMTPRQHLDGLVAKQLYEDAVRFLAYALPKRESCWWAAQCAKPVADPKNPTHAAAIAATEKWAAQPNDELRRATFPAAEAAEPGTAPGAAAMAVYFSGGSLAPADLPDVPPPAHLTGHFVALTVTLAATLPDPENAEEQFKKFIALGIEVANGTNRWKEPAAKK